MAAGKLIALEWDDREARVAVAMPRGSDIVVEDAFAIDISGAAGEEATSNVAEIGRRVAEALSQRDLRGCDALLGLGRTSIELRSLSLPKGPPEEIPDMVRFQALQAFTAIGDDWPLDYVELGEQGDAINVLAAVLAPKQLEQMRQVCAASELTPRCLVLRPFAAASLLHRAGVLKDDKSALIIDMLADGADLTAVADGQVTFMRTVRLPATTDEAVQARALLGEVRRTIAATQAQDGAQRIERIVICGSAAEHALLMQSLTESLQLEVLPFDPFQVVQVSSRVSRQSLTDAGRYAPLLGMLTDHVAGTRHAIDFLNPRKRPAPPSTRRRNMLIAAGVLAGVMVACFAMAAGLKYFDNKIAGLNEQIAELNLGVDRAKVLIAKADAVKDFTDIDVTLLDDLYEIAERIPDADHLRLDDVNFSTANLKRGAVISLKGHAKRPNVIAETEDSLRFEENTVEGRIGTQDRNQTEYPWLLDASVIVKPDGYDRGNSTGRPYRAARQADAKGTDPAKTKPEAANPEAAKPSASEPAEKSTDKNVSADAGKATDEMPETTAPKSDDGAPAATAPAAVTPESTGPAAAAPESPAPDAPAADGAPTVPAADAASPDAPPAKSAAPEAAPEATPESPAPESPATESPAPDAPAAESPTPAMPAAPAPATPAPATPAPAIPPATTPPPPDPTAAPPAPTNAPVETESVPPASADDAGSADKTEGKARRGESCE
jgi:Tfp pilus assembly PilM family ATPase